MGKKLFFSSYFFLSPGILKAIKEQKGFLLQSVINKVSDSVQREMKENKKNANSSE
jgi:hypothetical protein